MEDPKLPEGPKLKVEQFGIYTMGPKTTAIVIILGIIALGIYYLK